MNTKRIIYREPEIDTIDVNLCIDYRRIVAIERKEGNLALITKSGTAPLYYITSDTRISKGYADYMQLMISEMNKYDFHYF